MSVPIWPSVLTDPLRTGYLAQRQDIRARRAANGPPAYRRRFSSGARLVSLAIEVTRADKAVFDRFYDETTQDGTLPFYMPDPTTDGRAMLTDDGAPVLSGDGSPILLSATWLCIFGEPVPSERIVAGRFEISFNVAVMP